MTTAGLSDEVSSSHHISSSFCRIRSLGLVNNELGAELVHRAVSAAAVGGAVGLRAH